MAGGKCTSSVGIALSCVWIYLPVREPYILVWESKLPVEGRLCLWKKHTSCAGNLLPVGKCTFPYTDITVGKSHIPLEEMHLPLGEAFFLSGKCTARCAELYSCDGIELSVWIENCRGATFSLWGKCSFWFGNPSSCKGNALSYVHTYLPVMETQFPVWKENFRWVKPSSCGGNVPSGVGNHFPIGELSLPV